MSDEDEQVARAECGDRPERRRLVRRVLLGVAVPLELGQLPRLRLPQAMLTIRAGVVIGRPFWVGCDRTSLCSVTRHSSDVLLCFPGKA